MAQVQQHFGEREPPLRLRLEDAREAGAEYHGEPRLGAVARAAQAGAHSRCQFFADIAKCCKS